MSPLFSADFREKKLKSRVESWVSSCSSLWILKRDAIPGLMMFNYDQIHSSYVQKEERRRRRQLRRRPECSKWAKVKLRETPSGDERSSQEQPYAVSMSSDQDDDDDGDSEQSIAAAVAGSMWSQPQCLKIRWWKTCLASLSLSSDFLSPSKSVLDDCCEKKRVWMRWWWWWWRRCAVLDDDEMLLMVKCNPQEDEGGKEAKEEEMLQQESNFTNGDPTLWSGVNPVKWKATTDSIRERVRRRFLICERWRCAIWSKSCCLTRDPLWVDDGYDALMELNDAETGRWSARDKMSI